MNLDAFRLIRLNDAEILSARTAADRLRFEHGDGASAALAEIVRRDENAYHTTTLGATGQSQRARLAKRLRGLRMIESWFATDGKVNPDDNLFPDVVTLATAPDGGLDDQAIRRHLFAAMLDATIAHKEKHGDGADVPNALLAELADLGSEKGMAELRKVLAKAQTMGLDAEGAYWLGIQSISADVWWLSTFQTPVTQDVRMLGWENAGVSQRSGKTRWRNNVTGEYRYQESEPGTRVRRQRSAEIAEHHMGNIHQQREVLAEHLDEMGKHLPSMTVKQLKQWRGIMGAWKVKGGSLKENIVKAVFSYAKGLVEQHKINESKSKSDLAAAGRMPARELRGVTKPKPTAAATHPDAAVVNAIDAKATPEEKVKQLVKMTAENKPKVDAFLKGLDAKFGTESKSNEKLPDRILSKSKRPSILAKKPWFGVEHVRDSFRFKTVVDDMTKLPEIINHLETELGAEVVKRDTDKFLQPLEWGWRITAFDLKMPNGQLVEYYLPVKELEAAKEEGHKIFEKWRNKDPKKLNVDQWREFEKDMEASRNHYQGAFDAYLTRSGNAESDLRAALAKAAASPEGTARKSSAVSAKEPNAKPDDQVPPLSEATKPSSTTYARPSGALEATATEKPSAGIVPTAAPPSSNSPAASQPLPAAAGSAQSAHGAPSAPPKPPADLAKKFAGMSREEKIAKLKGQKSAAPAPASAPPASGDTIITPATKPLTREEKIARIKALRGNVTSQTGNAKNAPYVHFTNHADKINEHGLKPGDGAFGPGTLYVAKNDSADQTGMWGMRGEVAIPVSIKPGAKVYTAKTEADLDKLAKIAGFDKWYKAEAVLNGMNEAKAQEAKKKLLDAGIDVVDNEYDAGEYTPPQVAILNPAVAIHHKKA